MDASSLHNLIEQLPAELKKEVYDFAAFLLEKQKQPSQKKPRVAGLHAGQTWISKDFDEPLPDEFWLGKDA
jgi:Protein of unknown function (DUF2281)